MARRNTSGLKRVKKAVRVKGKTIQRTVWMKANPKETHAARSGATGGGQKVPTWAKRAGVIAATTAVGALAGRSAGGRMGASAGKNLGRVVGGPIGAIGGALAMAAITGGSAAAMTLRNSRGTGASARQVGGAMFHNAMRIGGASAAAGAKAGAPIGYHASTGFGEFAGRTAGRQAGMYAGGATGLAAGVALSRLVR